MDKMGEMGHMTTGMPMDHSTMNHTGMDHSMMNHTGMDHSMMNHSGMSMMMMKMYFHTGVEETVLFQQWKITNVGELIGSCLGIFFFAILYEGLKVLREHLLRKYNVHMRYNSYPVPNSNSTSSHDAMIMETHKVAQAKLCSWPHFLQTLLHIVQVVMSYFLMLIFMTYNIWLCLAVALGAGGGYFVFGWKKAIVVDVNEHCH
ncbi:high affinity copper uptake protein 1-like [Lineus longissimus]|uniref:high affinity copper uptake protein 1-like n=1 Tax=Lineus longissimus TaxID=88925 RepID=UPI002B4E74C8